MKKLLSIVVVLGLTLSLSGCAELDKLKNVDLPPLPTLTAAPAEEPSPTPAPTEEPSPSPEAAEEPTAVEATEEGDADEAMRQCVVVNFRKTELVEYDPAEGTQKILSFSYTTPHVSIPGREEAADAINEYIAMLDETYVTGNDYGDGPSDGYNGMLEQALDNFSYVYDTGTELPLEYSSARDAEVTRADGRVLSLVLTTSTYTGGAHGLYAGSAYVFDTRSGELLTLDRLTPDYAAFSDFVVGKMVEQAQQDAQLHDAIASFIDESEWARSFAHLLREGSWYLDRNGLVLFSTLYELAPYAAGIQYFTVSYEELGELLYERWHVGEKQGEGGFEALPMAQVEEGGFPILDYVLIDEDAAQICLHSGACVYDVTLQSVSYLEELDRFFPQQTLWFCSCMQDAGVQLSVEIPEVVPKLLLSYRTHDGEMRRCLLTQSGMDGSYVLMEDGFELYTD